jgi:3,4-dihydroxy 2-butanone 4-phosphate synthase/GTP cyclohydrolase II
LPKKYGLKIISVADLIAYRSRHEKLVRRVAEAKLPSKYGEFTVLAFKSDVDPANTLPW